MKTKLIIEFSDKYLKAAVMDSAGLSSRLKNVFLEPLEPNFRNVPAALANLLKQIGRKKAITVTAILSRNKITMRKVDLPSREKNEIEQMLSLHIIKQVPYPKEEIIWGYQNLGFEGSSNTKILLGIVHRDILRSIFNGLSSLNIFPDNVLMSSPGVCNFVQTSLKDLPAEQPYLILDVDYNYSDLLLVHKQQLTSSAIISFGLEQLKDEAVRPGLVAELEQVMLSFRNELSQNPPGQLFLCGGAENIGGLDDYLGKELNLKARFAGNKNNIPVSGLPFKTASFSSVLGFAGQQKKEGIAFSLPEIGLKKEMRQKIRQLLILGISAVYIFTLLALIIFLNLNQRQEYQEKLNLKVKGLKEKSGQLAQMSRKIETVKKYANPRESVLNYLNELIRLCPDAVTVSAFLWDSQKGSIIRGYAYQMQDIFNFVNVLENSESFKGMQARSTRRRKLKDKEVIDFEIGLK